MKRFYAVLITVDIFKSEAPKLESLIKSFGINEYVMQTMRTVAMTEVKGLRSLFRAHDLEEDPVERFSITASKFKVQDFIDRVMSELNLNIPGRGAIFIEKVEVACRDNQDEFDSSTYEDISYLLNDLVRIRAVVQRGQGNILAEAALDYGLSVPAVSFGAGAGLREKLGLLRITIPVEKEVVDIVVNESDALDIFHALVEEGKLDEPGKGFIYTTPILEGMVNPHVFRGKQRHAASMEQVIHALDLIQGDPRWRRRMKTQRGDNSSRPLLKHNSELVLTCKEGYGSHFTLVAMSAGATGSTIQHSKAFTKIGNAYDSQAIEECHLVVPQNSVDTIIKALTEADLFTEKADGCMVIRKSPIACTFLGA